MAYCCVIHGVNTENDNCPVCELVEDRQRLIDRAIEAETACIELYNLIEKLLRGLSDLRTRGTEVRSNIGVLWLVDDLLVKYQRLFDELRYKMPLPRKGEEDARNSVCR